jgi:hypothetical protein
MVEVVLDLRRRGADLVGHRRLQHAVLGVQLDDFLRLSGRQRRVPAVEQARDFLFGRSRRRRRHIVIAGWRFGCISGGSGQQRGDQEQFFHGVFLGCDLRKMTSNS